MFMPVIMCLLLLACAQSRSVGEDRLCEMRCVNPRRNDGGHCPAYCPDGPTCRVAVTGEVLKVDEPPRKIGPKLCKCRPSTSEYWDVAKCYM